MKVGQTKSGRRSTTVRNTKNANNAVALKGQVTTTGAGAGTAGVRGESAALDGNGVLGSRRTGPLPRVCAATRPPARACTARAVRPASTAPARTTASGVTAPTTTVSSARAGIRASSAVVRTARTAVVTARVPIGTSGPGYGIYGLGSIGAVGIGDGNGYGAWGYNADSGGYGVVGQGGFRGVYGSAAHAGYFQGNVHVNGTLTKTAGAFQIDHPLEPGRRYLVHSFVEISRAAQRVQRHRTTQLPRAGHGPLASVFRGGQRRVSDTS